MDRRLLGVDATRGVAVLGMMAVHVLPAADPSGEPTWWFSLAGGRASATFAVLAGVGVALLTGRAAVPAGRRGAVAASLAVRAVAVGVIGLALGYTDPSFAAVILPYYALLFLLAIPLVYLPTAWVAVTGVVVAVGMPVVSHLVRNALPEPRRGNPSFGYLLDDPLGLLTELALTGFYPALPWTAYLCAGLVVGRLRLSSPRTASSLLVSGAAMAAAASLLSWLLLGPLGGRARLEARAGASDVAETLAFGPLGSMPTSSWWWLAADVQHSATPLDLLHTSGTAVALLGTLLLVERVGRAVLVPLGAVGSMTLTVYTAHVVFLNSPLNVVASPLADYAVQVVAAVLVALAWRGAIGRGPLEAGVSRLSRSAGDVVTARG